MNWLFLTPVRGSFLTRLVVEGRFTLAMTSLCSLYATSWVCCYSDGLMTLSDFAALCRTLFRNEQGKAYAIEDDRLQEMFDVFDRNQVL